MPAFESYGSSSENFLLLPY